MIKLIYSYDEDDERDPEIMIKSDNSDLTITDLNDLFIRFAHAIGYHPNNIKDVLGESS